LTVFGLRERLLEISVVRLPSTISMAICISREDNFSNGVAATPYQLASICLRAMFADTYCKPLLTVRTASIIPLAGQPLVR